MNTKDEGRLGVDVGASGQSYVKNGEWTLIDHYIMVRAEVECIY
jgi:hypothetical protein